MKRFIIYSFLFLSLTSCKKFLYQEPYNNLSLNDVFKDFEGARTTLTGCYDDLRATDYYLRTFSIYPEITGGNIKYTRSANLALQNSYNFANDINVNDMTNFYKNGYTLVYGVNNIIANINQAKDASILQKNGLVAQAYCIRAMVYFDMVRVFSQSMGFSASGNHPAIAARNYNVPILTPAGTVNTCREVYDRINADLDSALLLFANSTNVFPNIGDARNYFSADAAKALQSRVALYTYDWAKVIATSSDVINSPKYSLISTGNYVSSWSGQTISSESIFELNFGNRPAGSLGDYYNPATANNTWQLAATNDLLNLFTSNDVRGQATMYTPRVVNGVTFYSPNKYLGIGAALGNNIKILRESELFLNRAEAYAETNNLTAALADLNRIRQRANPTASAFSSTDKQVILTEIFNERRRELCFEGHLFFDISRRKMNLNRADCNATSCSFTYPDARYAVVIPNVN